MNAANGPSLAQMRNRVCDLHTAVLRAIASGCKIDRPSLGHLRAFRTLARWGCIDACDQLTETGEALAASCGIRRA